jgi:sensor c-di-GMP phosphodiesterase-like protein
MSNSLTLQTTGPSTFTASNISGSKMDSIPPGTTIQITGDFTVSTGASLSSAVYLSSSSTSSTSFSQADKTSLGLVAEDLRSLGCSVDYLGDNSFKFKGNLTESQVENIEMVYSSNSTSHLMVSNIIMQYINLTPTDIDANVVSIWETGINRKLSSAVNKTVKTSLTAGDGVGRTIQLGQIQSVSLVDDIANIIGATQTQGFQKLITGGTISISPLAGKK